MSAFLPFRKPVQRDELELQQLKARGARAEALVRDETLSEALVRVEQIYMQAWAGSDPFDVDTRERAYVATKLLGDLKAQLIQFVREGEHATKQLIKEAQRGRRAA